MIGGQSLDLAQDTLKAIALKYGVSIEELHKKIDPETEMREWSVDYRSSLELGVDEQLRSIIEAFRLVSDALKQEDALAL